MFAWEMLHEQMWPESEDGSKPDKLEAAWDKGVKCVKNWQIQVLFIKNMNANERL